MACLLVVDDEPLNLAVIAEFLRGQSHELVFANDGQEAWELLEAAPTRFHTVILDRIMPRLDGMALLGRMKADPRFAMVPVIMQTAATTPDQVAEGLEAGAWYYLAKPYRQAALNGIVYAALNDYHSRQELARVGDELLGLLAMTRQAQYHFRTPQEARMLATIMARLCPANQGAVAMGLVELLLNAVEHGNLAIGYQEKSLLMERGCWQEEVERRLALPEYAECWAKLEFVRQGDTLRFTIHDQGAGFDWHHYLELDPARAFDSHGRGIAMARMLAFSSLEYQGAGNVVTATVGPAGAGQA